MLFCDLSDSTALGAELEAEVYADLMVQLHRLCEAVVTRHGGVVVRMQGDGMLAMFGHPIAGEDYGRRATRAALEVHEGLRGLSVEGADLGARPLAMHSGIHAGWMLVNEGDVMRGRYELIGNPPNVASRLSALARRDQILVTEETLGPWRQQFVTGERRMLALRGKAETLAVYEVQGVAAGGTGAAVLARRSVARFVGRRDELAQLETALRQSLDERALHQMAIVAPPGVGKTRLAEELLMRAARLDCQLLRGYGESDLSGSPLQPFLQMLRSFCALERDMSVADAAAVVQLSLMNLSAALQPHQAELLDLLSLSIEAPPARPSLERRLTALLAWLDAVAARGPVVLFIDDWQWTDTATRQALGAIRSLAGRPIFVLLATRGFDAGDADLHAASVLALSPLGEEAARETIDGLLPAGDPFIAAEIQRYAGGNPLFIEELCHSAAHGGGDRPLGRPLNAAAWLQMLIESRVARLPSGQAEMVRAAAVIGNVIPCWLLERLTGVGRDDPVVQALAAADFVFPGELSGTLRFKHGITRDVIYDAVGLHARRALHHRIAEALAERMATSSGDDSLEALAYHRAAAGDHAEAARYAEMAGDKAVTTSALDRAQAQYLAALTALEKVGTDAEGYGRWMSIMARYALVAIFDPSHESIGVLQRALTRSVAHQDHARVAHAAYWLGYVTWAVGDSRGGIPHLEQALTAARRVNDQRLAVQIRAALGQARAAASDYPRALDLLDEAIQIKRQHRSGTRPAVGSAFALAAHASAVGDMGRFREAGEMIDEALEVVAGASHEVEGSVLAWKAGLLLWQGRWAEAAEAALAAERVGERVKSLYVFAMGRSLGARAQWCLQPGAAPLQRLIDATGWLEARGKRLYISLNHGWLAEALVECDRPIDARRYAAAALRRVRRLDRFGEAMTLRALAVASAKADDPQRAQRHLAQAMTAADARRSPHERAVTQLCAARLALRWGRAAEARERAGSALEVFESLRMDWHRQQATALLDAL